MQWQEFRTSLRHLPAKDIERIERAFTLGKTVHADQKRKSGEPYFNHPVAVARILIDLGADADTIIAALLHDTVEDTPLTLKEIDHLFDGNTATLIDGVTKLSVQDIEGSPKLNEQMETLRKIFTLMQEDVRIMVIKIVDRLHNMQTVEFLSKERQLSLAKETLDIYVKIADKLCMQDLRDELEALCLSILEPENLTKLTEIRAQNEQRGTEIAEEMRTKVRSHDAILAARVQMSYEYKKWDQLRSQMNIGDSVATGFPMITIALICDDIDTCYRVLGSLHQLWKREVLSFQDFINAPQLNGYQGLHTTIIAQDGTRVRCKIRTRNMHAYARKGIATSCFDSKAQGLSEYLPWTKQIPTLTSDTEGSSEDFWQSLQSDILGESIVIHGPGDTTIQLPRNATALDGAFYLLQRQALYTDTVKVNGKEVSFGTKLANAATVDVIVGKNKTCHRDWLASVQTGVAAAAIRIELSKQSEAQKLSTGREMLQNIFTERKRGFIEEYDEKGFEKQLQILGYRSLHEVYTSIADGRLEPIEVYYGLFEPKEKKRKHTNWSLVKYDVNMEALDVMDRVNLVHRRYSSALSDIRYHRSEDATGSVTLRVRMDATELANFQQEITIAGGRHTTVLRQSYALAALIGSIVILWGLDPVIARQLLVSTSLTPTDLTTIRFMTFFAASTITYVLHMLLSRVKANPISPLKPSFIASAVSLFLTAILSYVSLRELSATQYILFIIAGLVGTGIIELFLERELKIRSVLSGFALGIALYIAIAIRGYTLIGILAAIGSSLGFSMYTQLSRRYLGTDARIHARYPAFVFWLSLLTILLSLTIVPGMQSLHVIGWSVMVKAVLFAFVFTFLPYALFFECMQKADTDILDRLLPFVSIITVLGELYFEGPLSALLLLPCIGLFLWLYKPNWFAQSK